MGNSPAASITAPKGFRAAGGTCGIKASGKPDLALIVADEPCVAAGVFTTNQIKGAPVVIGQRHLQKSRSRKAFAGFRAIVCNSGNSNVATGQPGLDDAIAMCKAAADAVGCEAGQVLPASTGVIGRPLPIGKIVDGVPKLASALSKGKAADHAAATAILTTDLVTKTAVKRIKLGGKTVTLGGIAKGSGMIAPSMATMLAFITTDAGLDHADASRLLQRACSHSFGRISVDTDTSTSDTVYLLASGASGVTIDKQTDRDALLGALTEVCQKLAEAIIQDGEGATKTFAVEVTGALSEKDADKVGRAVTDSPLVKCAVHGGDPNWGRLAMAVGKSGAKLDPAKLVIRIGKTDVFRDEVPIKFTPAVEKKLEAVMAKPRITFGVDLGLGDHAATWLGCDLSREYITINADYTT